MNIDYEGLTARIVQGSEDFALLTMQATSTTRRLIAAAPERLVALFSAEHGFFGCAAPGEKTASTRHPLWNRPIRSLYGEHRTPSDEMLAGIGRMVIDLCDIGVRCYTYLATLRNVLKACAAHGIPVTVLDRPVPLGGVVDGPMREEAFSSFVAPVNVPLCHGMTPGECATWIARQEGLALDLDVVRLRGWSHADRAPWPNFVPPSPAIRSWDSAVLYPMTVFTEAYGAVDCDRTGSLAFRVVGLPGLDQAALLDDLTPVLAPLGVEVRPYRYVPSSGEYADRTLDGILFSVADPAAFRPAEAGIRVFAALRRRQGAAVLEEARPEWMDKLYGSSETRLALEAGTDAALDALFAGWRAAHAEYAKTRVDLYER